MSLNSNALTSLAMAKQYLKIPALNTDQDSMIELFINSASQYIETKCQRLLKSQSHTEYLHGRRQNILLLKEWPVTSITTVHVDNECDFGSDTLIDSDTYRVGDHGNSLIYINSVFPNGYNNIKVVYTAGYVTVPADLEHATLWMVAWYQTTRDNKDIGRPRKSKGDESFDILQSAPQDVIDCINRYKRTEVPGLNALTLNL